MPFRKKCYIVRTWNSWWEISLPESVFFQHLTGEVSDLLAMETVIIDCGDSHYWLSTIQHLDWTGKQTSVHIFVVSSLNLLKKKTSFKEWLHHPMDWCPGWNKKEKVSWASASSSLLLDMLQYDRPSQELLSAWSPTFPVVVDLP